MIRLLLPLLAFVVAGTAFAAGTKPVNVVFILTDNQGAWSLGCYGNPDIRTPHIDRLAAEGVRFTRALSSNPVCSPTRATFLTGLIPPSTACTPSSTRSS
jgi:arylsulfatase A-like enzyme